MTWSLLPDCLAARLRGSLDDVEQVVVTVEESPSVERAASALRPEIDLPGAMRWVRRRLVGVRLALGLLITLMPGQFGPQASLRAVRASLSTDRALVALRQMAGARLVEVPRPVGFHRRAHGGEAPGQGGSQHETGPDPPS